MSVTDYVSVRRPTDAPFGVLPEDLIVETLPGCEIDLMRSISLDGLHTPIAVRPIGEGRFEVVDGRKRLAAIRMLVRLNRMVHDGVRELARPAREVFALVRCRIRARRSASSSGPPAPID